MVTTFEVSPSSGHITELIFEYANLLTSVVAFINTGVTDTSKDCPVAKFIFCHPAATLVLVCH